MIVCLACSASAIAELDTIAPRLVTVTPRVVVEPRGIVWCDAHGLDARAVALGALRLVREATGDADQAGVAPARNRTGPSARAGVADTPVAAAVAAALGVARPRAAREAREARAPIPPLTFVPRGADAAFLAPHPIEVLEPSDQLCTLLRGSGIELCGDLAALDHESVEVRFGAEGSRVWHLARADDRRRLFPPMQRTLPESSLEWVDYVLTEPEQLLFVINALMGNVCGQLAEHGAGAREMTLVFSLANRSSYEHQLRPARVTGSQRAWMRLVRSELERITLPDAVTGITLRVVSIAGELPRQGDLFDRGFATARMTEEAVAQLLDDSGVLLAAPQNTAHPLLEQRTEWIAQDASVAVESAARQVELAPRLAPQLLPEPRPILVEVDHRRDHELPARCCLAEGWQEIAAVTGPQRISGGEWESPFARDYYCCVTTGGRMVLLFRDTEARWFMAGWWD